MAAPTPKRSVWTTAFWMRFVPWTTMTFGVCLSIALGIGAFSPVAGEITAKLSILLALYVGWSAGRELSSVELDQWHVDQALPTQPTIFYYRRDGEIFGPEPLEEIRKRHVDSSGIEVLEAAGQNIAELRRSRWTFLATIEAQEAEEEARALEVQAP